MTIPSGPLADVTAEPADGGWTLVFVRDLRHPPARVWTALTEPGQLRAWAPFVPDRDLAGTGPVTLTMLDADDPADLRDGPAGRAADPARVHLGRGPAPLGAGRGRRRHPADPAAPGHRPGLAGQGRRRLAPLPGRGRAAAGRAAGAADPGRGRPRPRLGRAQRGLRGEARRRLSPADRTPPTRVPRPAPPTRLAARPEGSAAGRTPPSARRSRRCGTGPSRRGVPADRDRRADRVRRRVHRGCRRAARHRERR